MDMGGNSHGLFYRICLKGLLISQNSWAGPTIEPETSPTRSTGIQLYTVTFAFLSSCLGGGGMRPYVLPRLATALPVIYMASCAVYFPLAFPVYVRADNKNTQLLITEHKLDQWYSTWGTRTPGGTRRHLRGYVKSKKTKKKTWYTHYLIIEKIFNYIIFLS
jgi:hypothetical protein